MEGLERSVRAVIGTAGHIDHGKTTLVKHLTGIDTDRLREEKQRGISIELGFAWLDLPAGRVAIVDVPGHERFVRQMIAGAAGIDLVLLVVAADEGVMPQTLEHLDICQLLGVRTGAIVVTKADLVDEEWLELVVDDLASSVEGTFLEGAPVLTYAAGDEAAARTVTEGIEAVVSRADAQQLLARRSPDRPFKLSIDRTFSMRGFGTVVTGTTTSGTVALGDSVEVLPRGQSGRVRGIQVHGQSVKRVGPGARTAINVQGVDHDHVGRGDVVSQPGALEPTLMFDGTFTALGRLSKPIRHRERVLVHLGTAQIQGTISVLGASVVAPGDTSFVQVRLDQPAAILPGEPYVIRGFRVLERYGKTLGGGVALMPQRRRHRRTNQRAQAMLADVASGDPRRAVVGLVGFAGDAGIPRQLAVRRLPLERAACTRAMDEAVEVGELLAAGDSLYSRDSAERLESEALQVVDEYHAANQAKAGIRVEELRTRVRPDLRADFFALVVERLLERGALLRAGRDSVARRDFVPRRNARQQAACEAVLDAVTGAGLTPPRVQDLAEEIEQDQAAIQEALELLIDAGELIRVSQALVYPPAAIADLAERVEAFLEQHGTMDTAQLKELTGASRKWTIPLGEYFDRTQLTIRVGDLRRLRS